MNKKSSGKLIFAGIIFVMFFSICSNITITTPDQDFIAKMTTSIDTSKDSAVESKDFVKNTGLIWNFTSETTIGSYSSPAEDNGFVYAGSADGNLYCLNASNGNKVWNYVTNGTIYSSPAVENGFVYFGSMDSNVYCLNASNGNWIWNYTTGDMVISSPVVENGLVYAGSNDGNLYCLDASNGNKVWNYTTGAEVDSSPEVVEESVYFGSADFNVYCLNASNGNWIWNYTTDDRVDSSPAVVNGSVYIGSEDNNLYCLDTLTGTKIWNYTTDGWVDSSPAVDNGLVFVGSQDNNIYCVNASTGSMVWQQLLDKYVISSPAVADGLVYIGSEANKIFCLNTSTGFQLWYYNTTNHIASRPTIANGYVYITCSIGQNSGVVCFPMMFVASAPQNFQATGGIKQIALSWGNPAIDLGPEYFHFNIYRGTSPENMTYLTKVLKSSTVNHTYTDTGLADATTYYYKITALCEGFASYYEGFFSDTINATTGTTTPSSPMEVKINASEGQIVLSWQPPQSNGGFPITGYKIYRGMNPDSETLLTTVSGSILNYSDTGLTNKQEYYYKVSAVNELGEGLKSSEVMAIFKGQESSDNSIGGSSFIFLLMTSFIGVITLASVIKKRYKTI